MPVLILKIQKRNNNKSSVSTPCVNVCIEWAAFELIGDDFDDTESQSSISSLTTDLQNLTTTEKIQPSEKKTVSPSFLCLLEYVLRLTNLEMNEKKKHTECNDQILCHYLNGYEKDYNLKDFTKVGGVEGSPSGHLRTRLTDRFRDE
jgi:hypothetical protein